MFKGLQQSTRSEKISQNIEESTGLMYKIKNEDVYKDYNSNKEILDFIKYSTKSEQDDG